MRGKDMLAIVDILTDDEGERCIKLYREVKTNSRNGAAMRLFAHRCADEIIKSILDRINRKTGQDNDPVFVAYMIEFAIMLALEDDAAPAESPAAAFNGRRPGEIVNV